MMLILIADDDPETCALVGAVLEQAGYATITARDAVQTVALTAQRRPDLIVLDIMMPAGTGVGALEKLKLSSRTAHIPVVVISGVADGARIEHVRQLGAIDFLPKPVDPEALLAVVRSALGPADTDRA
jgi:CheY-like chemotaxis protein